uniref:Complement component C7 n=1 Tax=Salarias fasciatus TaxID=181472 RepID=A0A672GY84_SALFA
MKDNIQLRKTVLPWLFSLFITTGFCEQRIHCQWGPYGAWSECDGCTKSQTRTRAMAVFAQFGGSRCGGGHSETRSCETTRGCPLEEGCGSWFRCLSGKCISPSLVCNGDQDCEGDMQDEVDCRVQKYIVCTGSVPPPNIELVGLGFDVVTGQRRATVINTKSFGGQCRRIFSGVHNNMYRLPLSTTQFNFLVKAQNDFSDEMFTSEWHYAKDIVNRETVSGTTTGFSNYDFHQSHDRTQVLLVLNNDIEVAQFQSNSPRYLPVSEELWKALIKLPSVYDYSAYRRVLERFGTHYLSEGSLGGSFKVITTLDEESERMTVSESHQSNECVRTKRWFLIFPITHVDCRKSEGHRTSPSSRLSTNRVIKVDVEGGGISHIAALKTMQLSDHDKNWEMYSNWADSVRSFPQIIKQKLRPLSELVKEVQCAGVKKLYLRRAIDQYSSENDPCHCRPCRNNGIAVMNRQECKCICKPNTSGLACEQGSEAGGQQGVIDGRWSCWSGWSSCSRGRRSRSRSCSNPTPQNGGQFCIGESTETSDCEDQELQYLQTMEPQCFDHSLPETPKCGPPPTLINGYILDPKDAYYVGNKVEYTCTNEFYLTGQTIIECTSDLTWSASPGLCTVSRCTIESLADGVIVTPSKQNYGIGESVTFSCPEGRELQGEAISICDPSLHFSPDPADVTCSQGKLPFKFKSASAECKPWEKSSRGQCFCKMPFECSSSVQFCAKDPASGKSFVVSACKMHALQCLGKNYIIAEDSACTWPQRIIASCADCHMWETCDDGTNECRCKDAADCSSPRLDVCVRVGEDGNAANQTMSECEAGLRQCKGEKVAIVGILPCAS